MKIGKYSVSVWLLSGVFIYLNIFLLGNAPATIYDFEMTNIDGNKVSLSQFKDKVVLIVNTASKCGLTPQYKELQEIYDKYKDQGFIILGFPANNFREQEPGSNAEIKKFCTLNYGVTFPMFAKISVKGEDIHPLYRFLTSEETDPQFAGEIRWNFDKFLIDKKGKIINRFHPKITPSDPKLVKAIEKALED